MDIDAKFEKAIDELKDTLPKEMPAGCAEATLGNILKILGTEDQTINNLMVPLSGGLEGYKSQKGWFEPCGAVVGGCAAVGVILGGKEKKAMDPNTIMLA